MLPEFQLNLEMAVTVFQAKLPIAAFPAKAEIIPEPLGAVLIFSSWNLPIGDDQQKLSLFFTPFHFMHVKHVLK